MKCKFCDGSGKDYWELNGVPYPCPVCNGTGEVQVTGDSVTDICDKCGGTGKGVIEPLTNEEWLKQCTTEQLAEFLADKCNEVVETVLSDASCDIGDIDNDDYWYRQADFVEWLKEKHE